MASFHNTAEVHHQVAHQTVHGGVHHHVNQVVYGQPQPINQYSTHRSWAEETAEHCSDLTFVQLKHQKGDWIVILGSLAFPQMTDRRRDVATAHRRTCQWIFDHPDYRRWRASPCGLLWIKGKPGAGKSTLMAHLYTAIRAEHLSSTDGAVYLEFFFSARGTPLQQSPLGMLRSLANQIYIHGPDARPLLRAAFQQNHSPFGVSGHRWEWSRPELETLVTDMILTLARQRSVTVIVDALDEAGEQAASDMASYFHTLNDQALEISAKAKFCISCRHYPVPYIVQAVEVRVEDHNRGDILAYVRDQIDVRRLSLHRPGDRSEWQSLVDGIAKTANGVFQWACLVVPMVKRQIADGDSLDKIRQQLSHVPRELKETYGYIIERVIDPRHRERSRRLFQWVSLASRPLTLRELRCAMATHHLEVSSPPLIRCHETSDFVATDGDMRQCVRSWSGGLVEVVGGQENVYGSELVAQPTHMSVKDFLLTQGFNLLAGFGLDQRGREVRPIDSDKVEATTRVAMCQGELYQSCLKYMISEGEVLTASSHPLQLKGTMAEYAVLNALAHALRAREHRGIDLDLETQLLEQALPAWTTSWEVLEWPSITGLRRGASPLHVAAAADLTDLAGHLLRRGDNVDAKDDDGQTALHVAATYGHLVLIETLVKAGADTQATTAENMSPIMLAASRGHVEVFSFLLSESTGSDAGGERLDRVLYAAASYGNEVLTKLCIDAGANVNSRMPVYIQARWVGSPLQAAALDGHENVVQILLDHGADIDAGGGRYGTPLYAAAYFDREKVVALLLEEGAETNLKEGPIGSPLQVAASKGHDGIVQLLIDFDADVNVRGGYHGSALQAACNSGHIDTVQMLLDHGADVNAREGILGSALQAASNRGRTRIVQKLLDYGADVNAQEGHLGSALQLASKSGHRGIVQMLLDHGADVNARKGRCGSALHAASLAGFKDIEQLLLEHGARR